MGNLGQEAIDSQQEAFLSKYNIKEELASGVTSSVHRIEDKITGQSYACKIINIDGPERNFKDAEGLTLLEQTLQEIEILKVVGNHENIVSFLGDFHSASHIYLMFEYCPRGDLFDLLSSEGRLDEARTAEYSGQLLEAIRHCHSLGVVHRDVKLENILISQEGKIKLSDFGMARTLRQDERLYGICGTPSYIAPEVWKSGMYEKQYCEGYSYEADLWSCGVILFALLSGNFPFEARSQIILMRQIRAGKLNFSSKLWREVSQEPKDLLSKLLTVDLDKRIAVEECLNHKFLKPTVNSSFDDELDALSVSIEGIEILKETELLYNSHIWASVSDTDYKNVYF